MLWLIYRPIESLEQEGEKGRIRLWLFLRSLEVLCRAAMYNPGGRFVSCIYMGVDKVIARMGIDLVN